MKPTVRELPGTWLDKLHSRLSACSSVEEVGRVLNELDPTFLSEGEAEAVVRQLQVTTDHGKLLELVLSYGRWSAPLSTWLLKTFPKSVEAYLGSLHRDVLERLSLFLTFTQHSLGRDVDRALLEDRAVVELAPSVMAGLLSFSLDEPEASPVEPVEHEVDGFRIGTKQKQAQKKQARKAKRQSVALSARDLQRLGMEEPRTRLEAYTGAQAILDEAGQIIQGYLRMLQHQSVASMVQGTFIKQETTETTTYVENTEDEQGADIPPDLLQKTSSAYPCIQPMKAALYFESASGFGDWRILISTRADRDLRNARRSDQKFFKIVIKKIVELSNGHFSDDNQKRLTKEDVDFPVFEAKMTRDSRLVYQIDCIPEYDNDFERQVIKIFGVYTHAQIDKRFWNSMGYQLAKKGKTYRDRCTFRNRPHHTGDNVIPPASFPPQEREEHDTLIIPELPKEDLEEIHSLLVLEKFVTLSKELLTSIWADLDVAHVFNVTPQEKEIIEHPHSCYVLGRSGTGKTTTMLFKMLGLERAYALQDERVAGAAKPRQVFVTQSRVLASRVEEYFSKLLESLATAKKSKEELKRIADQKRQQEDESNLLYDVDDDVTWKAGLPEKFSLLEDEHFPLFLTFERLSQLLEGDTEHSKAGMAAKTDRKGRMVTYDVFFEQYWPHFPQDLTKNLDPALVFSELLGVIEGSEESLNHENRYLDQASYRNLSHRAQHVFAKQRDRIYSLFVAYLKQKRWAGDYDTADRTHRIVKAFESSGVPGTKIDYLYVDEAQDNLLVDAMLLRSLCRNPNGLFWAGDTAQTIAIGSSFRFNDLKAFLYRLEQRREQRLIEDGGITQSELRTFQLAVNYRSHGGIVRCATAVIELITHFWPYAIDSLAPEKGVVDGAKPVFFSGWDTNTVRYEQFLFGDSGERIEFGARQCILVRDEAARAELRQQVGDIGLILTLYESKGLEFDDVLLYKFFEDSKVELGQWRLVLNLVGHAYSKGLAAPRFDEERHAGVCSELKFLYVAITRSRKNLWIVDCSDKAEPMKMLWESKGFIQNCIPGGEVPRLAVSSSPEEWANTGRTLFNNRRYLQAMHAFDRAAMPREAKIAKTHYLRESARSIPPTNKESLLARREAFRDAARSFSECAQSSKGKEQKVYHHNAGDCYEQAGNCSDNLEDYGLAARAYQAAREYSSAVKLYRKSDQFDDAVYVVQHHREEVDKELAESVLDVARLFYFRKKDFGKAKTLFESVDEQLEYLEDNVLLDDCHAAVLAELGRFQEAADIHIEEGRTMDAIKVLLQDKGNSESTRRANTYILQGLWQTTSFSHKIKDDDTEAISLLSLASKVDTDLLSPSQKDEVSMFQNLRTGSTDPAVFRRLGQDFLKRQEQHQALLCLDHYFLNFPSLMDADNTVVFNFLNDFGVYCRLYRKVVAGLDLLDEQTQRLFNYQPASTENAYRLRMDTWIFKQATSSKANILESDEESVVLSAYDLHQLLRTALWNRLEGRLVEENQLCRYRAPAFRTPCLPFVMNGECRRFNCPRQHIDHEKLNQTWFNTQLRIHFLQILIYQVYHSIPSPKQTIPDRRYWIHRLHETLRPYAHYLGSQASVRMGSVPEALPAVEVVKKWIPDILFTRAGASDKMLLTFLYQAGALGNLFDPSTARLYLSRAPLLGIFANVPAFRRPRLGGKTSYVILELYHSMSGTEPFFISAGILFLQQVVEKRLMIEVNVLCHFVEFLCGSVVLALVKFQLHNVILPRGWLLSLLRQIKARNAETQFLDRLLHSLTILLQSLINGGEEARYLLYENRDLADLPAIRDLFIGRVCRALGLIGYNIDNRVLKDRILGVLKVLKPAKMHHSFKKFARADRWGHIVKAVESSYSGSQLDELVQLCLLEKQHPHQMPPPVGVRRVFFKSLEDVPLVLSTGPMRADAPAFVPKALAKPDPDTVGPVDDEADNEEAVEQVGEKPEADITDIVDSRNLVDSLGPTEVPAAEAITEEQKAVATKLIDVYQRKLRSRKLERAKTATHKAYDSYFKTCLEMSKTMDWPLGFYYRKLYLGLVPHLLACVNRVEAHAYNSRDRAKKRFRSGKDTKEDLESLNKRMNELSSTFKLSKATLKQLAPTSELHKKRDIEELKLIVGQVEGLVNRLPPGVNLDVQFNLDMAIKGIVTEPKVLKPAPKPDLNVENIVDEAYHDIDRYN